MKRLKSYNPDLICTDDPHLCEDLYVTCNDDYIYCEEGYKWHYNASISEFPFCLANEYIGDEYWFDYWYDIYINNHSSSSSETADDEENSNHPSIIYADTICRIGFISFNCSFDTCQNRTISCNSEELICNSDELEITGEFPDFKASCNGKQFICISEPECTVTKHPCNDYETCLSYIYECDPNEPNNCAYQAHDCYDGCWAQVS